MNEGLRKRVLGLKLLKTSSKGKDDLIQDQSDALVLLNEKIRNLERDLTSVFWDNEKLKKENEKLRNETWVLGEACEELQKALDEKTDGIVIENMVVNIDGGNINIPEEIERVCRCVSK